MILKLTDADGVVHRFSGSLLVVHTAGDGEDSRTGDISVDSAALGHGNTMGFPDTHENRKTLEEWEAAWAAGAQG